jgi:hypothetical protein
MNGISDAKSLTYGNYLSLDARGHSTTKNGNFSWRLGGSQDLALPNGITNAIGNPLSRMIADSDHLTSQNSPFRDVRHSRPLGGRRPSPRQIRLPLTIRFFCDTPASRSARHEMTGPYFPLL